MSFRTALIPGQARSAALRPLLVGFVLAGLPAVHPPAAAQVDKETGSVTPAASSALQEERTVEQLEQKIKDLEGSREIDEAVRKTAIEQYRLAIAQIKSLETSAAEARRFAESIQSAPAQSAAIRSALKAARTDPLQEIEGELATKRTSKELESLLTREQGKLSDATSKLANLEGLIKAQENRPAQIQEELKAANEKLDLARKELEKATPPNEHQALSASRREWILARQRARLAEIHKLEQESVSHSVRIELLRAERDRAVREVEKLKARVAELDKRVREVSTEEKRKAEEAAARAAERAKALEKDPAILSLRERTYALTTETKEASDKRDELKRQLERIEERAANLKNARLSTERMLEVAARSQPMAQVLLDQRRKLPGSRGNTAIALERQRILADLGLRLHQIDELITITSAVERALGKRQLDAALALLELPAIDPAMPPAQRERILDDLNGPPGKRSEGAFGGYDKALRDLREALEKHKEALVDVVHAENDLVQKARTFARLLDENLMWMPNADVIGPGSIAELGQAILWLVDPGGWIEVARALPPSSASEWALALLCTLMLAALIAARPRLLKRLEATATGVGKVQTDSILATLWAMILTALLASPGPLLLFYLSLRSGRGETFTGAVGAGLGAVVPLVLALEFWRQLARPGGIGVRHFRWNARAVQVFRRHLIWMGALSFAAVTLIAATEHSGDGMVCRSLGRVVLIAFLVALAAFVALVLRPNGPVLHLAFAHNRESVVWRSRRLWFSIAFLLPLTLAALAALGYYYTALQLADRLAATAGILAIAILLHGFAIRWLAIVRRRLALAQARERREAAQAQAQAEQGEEPLLSPEVEAFDLAAVDAQTRQLLRTLLSLGVLLALWFAWTSVLPALAVLDDVGLWSYETTIDGAPKTVWVTLGSIFGLLLILVATFAAARNLPAVLEIGLLQRLPLDSGARYAIKTITSYVLSAIGIVLAFNAVGVGWSNVQWLVAALSVGLGFGLQEIFANFVSGLIIFFERRIRVGDVVTVESATASEGVSGTVSRIRILGTTITTWDRREYVVPNKEFVTGHLLNWTLTDKVNRIVINVGVAYGSDTRQARELMLKVAREHPVVLDEPAPFTTFEAFGDSSLGLVLRAYLPDLNNRMATTTELHEAIDREFKAAGIEIAFPQQDLHIRSIDANLRIAPDSSEDDPPTSSRKTPP